MDANRSNDNDGNGNRHAIVVANQPKPILFPELNLQCHYEENNFYLSPIDPTLAFRSNDGAQATSVTGYQPPAGEFLYHKPHCPTTQDSFQHILGNDPSVTGIRFVLSEDLAHLAGDAISNSIHLRRLEFGCNLIHSPELLSTFFIRLAGNRSLEHLTISEACITDDANITGSTPGVDILGSLAPFFAQNHNLRCIEMHSFSSNICIGIPALASTLDDASTELRLERIDVSHSYIGDKGVADLVDAFTTSRGLCYLSELCLSSNLVGKLGCTAIAKLIRKSECKVRTLELGHNALDDTCILVLVEAFIGNSTLKNLGLVNQKFVTAQGWSVLIVCLNTICSVDKYSCDSVCLNDGAILTVQLISAAVKANASKYHDTHSVITGYQPPTDYLADFDYDEDIFQLLLDNDPRVTCVCVDSSTDLELAGASISRSIHLRCLEMIQMDMEDEDILDIEELLTFFRGVAENRSIEHFSINEMGFDETELNTVAAVAVVEILSPFFALNRNIRCIELMYTDFLIGTPSLVSALVSASSEWRLERIDLKYSNIGDEGVRDLIVAFNSSPGLCFLSEIYLKGNRIGQLGCTAIGKLLENSECIVRNLELEHNELDDSCIANLVNSFIRNSTLKYLSLRRQKYVTPKGWCVFLAYLTFRTCLLGKVCFEYEDLLDDAALACLGVSLASNKSVTHLAMSYSDRLNATPLGWRIFSTCLRRPESVIRELDLGGCTITDDGAVVLAAALLENTSVKKLTMSNTRSISSSGWIVCLNMLLNSSTLEDINLSKTNVDDEGALLLARLLGNGGTLRSLDVRECDSITISGWRAIASVLPSLTLEKLSLGGLGCVGTMLTEHADRREITADDDLIMSFANALTRNTSLTFLNLDFNVSVLGANALAKALCDKSSIDNTFASNHTLEYVIARSWYVWELPSMNSSCTNKSVVARDKILKYHFTDVDNCVHIFGPMEVTVLPTALSWIGRGQLGFPLMYNFLRSMPWLIESAEPAIDGLKPAEPIIEELTPLIVSNVVSNRGQSNEEVQDDDSEVPLMATGASCIILYLQENTMLTL
jgi:hypothetical protein